MWSPDKSEGSKSEESDDCRCIGERETMAGSESAVINEKQQKLCVHNSKANNLATGANAHPHGTQGEKSNKLLDTDEAHVEYSDSGFISGPQSQGFGDGKQLEDNSTPRTYNLISEIECTVDDQLKPIYDSGYINEESQPLSDELNVKLKPASDGGVAECLGKLNLQSEASMLRQQQPTNLQQPQAMNINKNNFDELNKRSAPPLLYTSHSPATLNCDTINSSAIQLTASNAWEKFYQQNDDGDTPLHLACIAGYVDVVSALIRMAPHPCLFNIQNDEAQTPLHLAAFRAHPKILRMLLIAGAEPSIRDSQGNTALHLACFTGEEQCVRALTIPISASEIHEAHRQFGHRSNDKTVSYLSCARLPSDMEIRNYDGERCVHLAAQAGHIDILRILVLYGADINAREGKSGRTPLHISMECSNEDLVNFLMDECQKLNLETATYAGLTAYQTASILNKPRLQSILVKRGAEQRSAPESDYDCSDSESDLDESKTYDRFGDPGYFVNFNANGVNPMTVA